MTLQRSQSEILRPITPKLKWWIAATVLALLSGWQWAVHQWLMDLPMALGHQVSALVGAAIVAGTLLAFLALVQRYEERLAEGSRIVWELDQDLRRSLAQRGDVLYRAARELEEIGARASPEAESLRRIAGDLDRIVAEDDHSSNLPVLDRRSIPQAAPGDPEKAGIP